MEFLDPDKKKQHNRRLVVGYVLMGVAILLAALILFMQSAGFDLDHKTGKVIQNGLIFVSSHPESATVYLNGKDQGRTDTRLTVPAGSYTVELKRDGYRDWKRSFNLEGSSIERLQYPVLFPTTLNQKDQRQYDNPPQFITQSPDRHWLLVQQPGSVTSFDVFNSNDPKATVEKIDLPANLLTATADTQHNELVEWSTDNRHVLVKHVFKDQSEYIMIDRQSPENSQNITKLLDLKTVTLSLRDKRADELYVFDEAAHTLKTANTKTKEMEDVLKDVVAFKSYGSDTLLYAVTESKNPTKTDVKFRDGGKDYAVRTYTDAGDFLLDVTRFDGHWYAVVGPKNEGRVTIYQDPMDHPKSDPTGLPQAYSVLIMKEPQFVSFSSNARFILVQSGAKFATFDAETNRRFYYDITTPLAGDQKARWMDGHRLLVESNGKVNVFDFDGINKQTLVDIQEGTLPYFDRDYTRLYTLARSRQDDSKAALTQTPLKLDLR